MTVSATAAPPIADEVELVVDLQLVLGRLVRRLRRSSPGPAGVAGMSALASLAASGGGGDDGDPGADGGAGMRLSDLAAVENVSAPTMTRIIDHLAEQGLVRRVPNPADGRSSLVRVTGAGTGVLAAVRDERGRQLLRGVRGLDAESLEALRSALPALALLAGDPRTERAGP